MIVLFLRWLQVPRIDHARLKFALQIHESADVEEAERFWQKLVGAGSDAFIKTTLKAHNPKTNRGNAEGSYRGCLGARVLDGADLYRRIEGWWTGLVLETERQNP